MSPLKIRQGDNVIVLAGKDRGKSGRVEAVLPARGRVVVTGVNILKKAVKATGQTRQAGLVEFPSPIHVSNVAIADPKGGKASRVGYKTTGTGKARRKVRIARKSGQEITSETAS